MGTLLGSFLTYTEDHLEAEMKASKEAILKLFVHQIFWCKFGYIVIFAIIWENKTCRNFG